MSSGSKNVIALVLINNICYSKKQKQIKERKKKNYQKKQNCLYEAMAEKLELQECIS